MISKETSCNTDRHLEKHATAHSELCGDHFLCVSIMWGHREGNDSSISPSFLDYILLVFMS